MRKQLTIKDCHLGDSSDLTVIAPIRRGFVPGLDAVTYKTRALRVLRTLHAGRAGSHEFDLARMLSDAVERVGRIHSVRMAVLEPADAILLAVTFDGAWESYVRVIWQKVARLLDMIFCNTEDYVDGWTHSFEEWGKWLRWRQAETSFLYATPTLTTDDARYLRMQEGLLRAKPNVDLQLAQTRAPAAEEIAFQWFSNGTDPTHMNRGIALDNLVETHPELFRQGVRSLAGLYRLADFYPPARADGAFLLRAAQELLPDFMRLLRKRSDYFDPGWEQAKSRFLEQLHWLAQDDPLPRAREVPPLPDTPKHDGLAAFQGGILEPFLNADHAVMLLVGCASPQAMRKLMKAAAPTSAEAQQRLQAGDIAFNLALSVEGLRLCGLTDAEVESLPQEFVQGMERRAGLLGDLRQNHPRRWRLPVANWAQGAAAEEVPDDQDAPRIALSAVHAVVQLRLVVAEGQGRDPKTSHDARNTLFAALQRIVDADAGISPLSLQWMERQRSDGKTVEHFGFQDGDSDPVLTRAAAGIHYPNQLHAGEALIGLANAADFAAPPPDERAFVQRLLRNGSFLVVRKLRQDLEVFEKVLERTLLASSSAGLTREDVLGKMMGRWPVGHTQAGQPLSGLPTDKANDNDFNYASDESGSVCPLHAHIRRANPRSQIRPELQEQMQRGQRPPRLFRRGMSYGPPHNRKESDAHKHADSLARERGLVFMAYNASLGEQFETVQRWLSGGNSSGGYSEQGDPFLGVCAPGVEQTYRFEQGGNVVRAVVGGDTDMLAEQKQMVRLEWGGYFLAPSPEALTLLDSRLEKLSAAQPKDHAFWSVDDGVETIAALRALEAREGVDAAHLAWKTVLEDPEAAAELTNASVWAAIREHHGGLLRTPYGLLVASRELVDTVLNDPQNMLSSTGYLPRMRAAFGPIYLGMDGRQDDGQYEYEALACNRAILALDQGDAVELARRAVANQLDQWLAEAIDFAHRNEALRRLRSRPPREVVRWDLTIEVRELVEELLAVFCERWFGLSERGGFMRRAGFRWTWGMGQPACYPGHFMAPSRYIFQPHPEPTVEEIGASHGQSMRSATKRYLQEFGDKLNAPVARAVLDSAPGVRDVDFAARTLVGAMMGMVPTVEANLRRVLGQWLDEGTLWSLRAARANLPAADMAGHVRSAFVQAMQSRPSPDTLWRTAKRSFKLGAGVHALTVRPGEIVVAGLLSSSHDSLACGIPDLSAAFGGDRTGDKHPVHACPGYPPAMAMMLGFVGALVDSPLPLRPGPGTLTISLDGQEPYREPTQTPKALDAAEAVKTAINNGLAKEKIRERAMSAASILYRRGEEPSELLALRHAGLAEIRLVRPGQSELVPLWTFGDAWLGAPPAAGFVVPLAHVERGRTLASMAPLAPALARLLNAADPNKPSLQALIVGGGLNDLVEPGQDPSRTWLYRMLVPGADRLENALDETVLDAFVNKHLYSLYRSILDELAPVATVPIAIHGYDFPIPDGRQNGQPGRLRVPWLQPSFHARGMRSTPFNRDVMRVVIDRLNRMLTMVVGEYAAPARVHHLQLSGTLDTDAAGTNAHEAYWEDELNPSKAGYDRLGQVIASSLKCWGVGNQIG